MIHMAPIEIKEPVFIPEEKIPVRITRKAEEWTAFLKKIPKGQALSTTRKEIGVTASSLKTTLDRLIKNGYLPSNYYVRQHTMKDGTEKIYIVNSAHPVVKRKRSKRTETT